MQEKSLFAKSLYVIRDFQSRQMFKAVRRYCRGSVLDVGGWDFYKTAIKKNITFQSWTLLEISGEQFSENNDQRIRMILGDGCHMSFSENSFDTVLNIQVLEHVFEPILMVNEMARVLKENGYMILLVPQTNTIHAVPHHYYNFTRFWIEKALVKAGLEIIDLKPLGGVWSSMASHLFYFFPQSVRFPTMTSDKCRRNVFFYLLFPLMILFAILALPICIFLSIGDLTEEPNNHLVVAIKKPTQ